MVFLDNGKNHCFFCHCPVCCSPRKMLIMGADNGFLVFSQNREFCKINPQFSLVCEMLYRHPQSFDEFKMSNEGSTSALLKAADRRWTQCTNKRTVYIVVKKIKKNSRPKIC